MEGGGNAASPYFFIIIMLASTIHALLVAGGVSMYFVLYGDQYRLIWGFWGWASGWLAAMMAWRVSVPLAPSAGSEAVVYHSTEWGLMALGAIEGVSLTVILVALFLGQMPRSPTEMGRSDAESMEVG